MWVEVKVGSSIPQGLLLVLVESVLSELRWKEVGLEPCGHLGCDFSVAVEPT